MKKFNKIFRITVVALLVAIMTISLTACDSCNKDKESSYDIEYPNNSVTSSVSIDRASLDLIVGDTVQLKPTYNAIEGLTLSWSSENENVATVNNGIVEAVNKGETTVKVTYGTSSATCKVKVEFGTQTPSIRLSDNNLNISISDTDYYTFTPLIYFNGKTFNDATFTYSSSDESKVKIENGKIIPVAVTSDPITVTILADWRGLDVSVAPLLATTVSVSICNDVSITSGTALGFYKLYTRTEFEGETYINTGNFNPTFSLNGETVEEGVGFRVQVRDGDIATFEAQSGTVKGVKYGKTYLDVTATYDGLDYQKSFEIFVERPIANFSKPVKYFSAYSGMLKDDSNNYSTVSFSEYLFGKDSLEKVVEVVADGENITVKDDCVFGISTLSNDAREITLTVSSDYVSYVVPTTVYGAYVYHPADLAVFTRTETSAEYDGYVELGRDVNAKDFTLPEHTVSQLRANAITGYTGTFDGKGHAISDLSVNNYGLFASLTNATIKNVAFIDCVAASGDKVYSSLLAFNVTETVMENVYIRCNSISIGFGGTIDKSGSIIASNYITGGSFSNVLIESSQDMSNWGPASAYYQIFGAIVFDSKPTFKNCFVVSDVPLTAVAFEQKNMQLGVAENASMNITEQRFATVWDNVNYQLRWYWLFGKTRTEAWFKGLEPDENGVTYNYNAPYMELTEELQTKAKNRLAVFSGIRTYSTMSDLTSDPYNQNALSTFSAEYWMIKNGVLTWGENTLNQKSGTIILDVGEATGKTVYGLTTRQLTASEGDTINLPIGLTCPGLEFVCWKNAITGETVENSFVYDGSAMHLIAIWEVDDSYIQTPVT